MAIDERAWTPIVAEREAANRELTTPFPCRGEHNRYIGCIGARRCRGQGVTMCILGRWPDERQPGAVLGRGLAEAPSLPLTRPVTPDDRPPAARPAVSASGRPRYLVGVVHRDRLLRQAIGRQLQGAGYRTLGLSAVAAAIQTLDEPDRPAALLVDGALLQGDAAGERLLNLAATADVPVLSLPTGLRPHGSAEAAVRMAAVWLTVTLRPVTGARRAG
ncbi:MAG: hypothetical protein IT340_10400 [Chloroflexi bacterium]|nr:hypothetical protein [Chloroflexota bacterium]